MKIAVITRLFVSISLRKTTLLAVYRSSMALIREIAVSFIVAFENCPSPKLGKSERTVRQMLTLGREFHQNVDGGEVTGPLRLRKLHPILNPAIEEREFVEIGVAFEFRREVAYRFDQINIFFDICVAQ
jgi:hypothetical protein